VYLSDKVYVISHRPGRVVYQANVDLPRPRTLETTFEARFIDIVHDLRTRISHELTT
jgi:NitT/TauT family transport system ATP-binding protein